MKEIKKMREYRENIRSDIKILQRNIVLMKSRVSHDKYELEDIKEKEEIIKELERENENGTKEIRKEKEKLTEEDKKKYKIIIKGYKIWEKFAETCMSGRLDEINELYKINKEEIDIQSKRKNFGRDNITRLMEDIRDIIIWKWMIGTFKIDKNQIGKIMLERINEREYSMYGDKEIIEDACERIGKEDVWEMDISREWIKISVEDEYDTFKMLINSGFKIQDRHINLENIFRKIVEENDQEFINYFNDNHSYIYD